MDGDSALSFQEASVGRADEDLSNSFIGMLLIDRTQRLKGVSVVGRKHEVPVYGDGQAGRFTHSEREPQTEGMAPARARKTAHEVQFAHSHVEDDNVPSLVESVKSVQSGGVLRGLKPRINISRGITGCASMECHATCHLAPCHLRNVSAFLVIKDDPRHGERTTETLKQQVLLPNEQEVHKDNSVDDGSRLLQRRP